MLGVDDNLCTPLPWVIGEQVGSGGVTGVAGDRRRLVACSGVLAVQASGVALSGESGSSIAAGEGEVGLPAAAANGDAGVD